MLDFILSLIKKKYDYEKLYRPYIQHFTFYLRKYNREFYLGLAGVFLAYIAYTLVLAIAGEGFKAKTFDLAIQKRLSGPSPSDQIVIVDIDEKSIAHFSQTLGRWPWPREVLGEAIAGLEELEPSVIYLNLLLSEPDLANKNSDAVFQNVVGSYKNIVLPWVRLNPKNDAESRLTLADVPGFEPVEGPENIQTIAVIPSIFTDGAKSHGFSNLKEDPDGLIRRFDVSYQFLSGYIPSSALVAARIFLDDKNYLPKTEILLNWRNKNGEYKRISFSDMWADLQSGPEKIASEFKGKIVIVGVSAPGIANLKPTAAAPLVDDNEVVATAIDDLISQSFIRMMPQWIDALISAILIIAFCLSFVVGSYFKKTGLIVSTIQGALASITLGFISYTFYFVDLTQSIGLSLSFFGLCKLHQALDTRASRAEKLFSSVKLRECDKFYSVLVFGHQKTSDRAIKRFKRQLELSLTPNSVYYFDNIYDCTNLLETSLKGVGAFLFFSETECRLENQIIYFSGATGALFRGHLASDTPICFVCEPLGDVHILDDKEFNKAVSMDLLELSLKYLGRL